MTTVFSNSNPRIHKSGIFGPKFKDFYFCTKLCNKINSNALISNVTIIFSSTSPKMQKSDIFGHKFQDFYFLHETLQQGKIEGFDFKYDNGSFKIASQNT